MDKLKRYAKDSDGDMYVSQDGDWCFYTDVQAEVERLEERLEDDYGICEVCKRSSNYVRTHHFRSTLRRSGNGDR